MGTLLAVGIVAAIAGFAAGWFGGLRSSAAAREHRDLTLKYDQVIQEKKNFEHDVVEHFTETATLLNRLTESYREVHNHLAKGAATLCRDAGPVPLDRIESRYDAAEIPADLAHIQPPLDYAPKLSPDDKGILSEAYGLERKPLAAVGGKAE